MGSAGTGEERFGEVRLQSCVGGEGMDEETEAESATKALGPESSDTESEAEVSVTLLGGAGSLGLGAEPLPGHEAAEAAFGGKTSGHTTGRTPLGWCTHYH